MGVRVEIVGVGAYVKGAGDKRARPYRRGRVVTVDDTVAGRLIASGVAVREGERPEPVEPEAPAEVEVDLDGLTVDELEALARERGVYEQIEGTGKDGNVLKGDLVAALSAE